MRSSRRAVALPLLIVAATVVMANLNALVDKVLHPDIAYFDSEHLIVGGVTGVCALVLYVAISGVKRRLDAAEEELRALHEVVPICARCKRIQHPGADPSLQQSWEPIEHVVERMAQRPLSHGLCPECLRETFPDA